MKRFLLILLAVCFAAAPASAQGSGLRAAEFAIGPQVSTLGLGIAASAKPTAKLGISAEYNLFPFSSIERRGFDNELLIEPALRGGLLLVTFHPMGGKFSLAGGIQAGGANVDASLALAPGSNGTVELGDNTYAADDVGALNGSLEYGSAVQPTFMIGWMGKGFNAALGASLATPTLAITATGPLKDDPAFQADLQKEIDSFDDVAGKVPVYPYLRLGWQFGL
jgi:hypothetical protein